MTGSMECLLWVVGIGVAAFVPTFICNYEPRPFRAAPRHAGPRFRDNFIIYIVLWGLVLSSAAVTWWAIATDASWLAWACGVPMVMFLGLTFWFSVAPPEYETPPPTRG
jgi:hypothetical protein